MTTPPMGSPSLTFVERLAVPVILRSVREDGRRPCLAHRRWRGDAEDRIAGERLAVRGCLCTYARHCRCAFAPRSVNR